MKKTAALKATGWKRHGNCLWQILVDGTLYQLMKDRKSGAWYLYRANSVDEAAQTGMLWELKYEKDWIGFFSEGFGTSLAIAKRNARNYLVKGIGINDAEWII